MGQPRPLFIYFWSFQTNNNTILTTNQCEKCPSSIWRRDSNPQSSECKSPITTRPELPRIYFYYPTLGTLIKIHTKSNLDYCLSNLGRKLGIFNELFSIISGQISQKCRESGLFSSATSWLEKARPRARQRPNPGPNF